MKAGVALNQISKWLQYPIDVSALAFGACVDSRLLKAGDLFFACEGQKRDGHEFLHDVASRGAVGAVVKKDYRAPDDLHLPLIRVENPLKALQDLAKIVLANRSCKIVAITGSMGKTTTKGFLAKLLQTTYCVGATPGNSNSQIGLPLTILNEFHGDEEILVLEMGMTHPGNICSLVQIAPPELAIVTGVAHGHFEYFESLEGIAKAKAEILTHPNTCVGIVDHSILHFEAFKEVHHCPIHSFSVNDADAEYTLVPSKKGFKLMHAGKGLADFAPPPFPGKHNLHNFLAAIIAASICGVSHESLQKASSSLTLPSLRFQIEERGGALFIHDSYNALPIAVKAALDALPEPKSGGRKIAVLSEMRELGSVSELLHREVAEYALERVDLLFCMGERCAPMIEIWNRAGRASVHVNKISEIISLLQTEIRPGDVVLIKGSATSGFSSL